MATKMKKYQVRGEVKTTTGSLGDYIKENSPVGPKPKKRGMITKKYKTGGMVNANANLVADKTAGSKGVKSGVNPKASASKVAKGRVGGTSVAPKKATPKAKYGMTMKSGGTKKSC
jgi:hypothetical protein